MQSMDYEQLKAGIEGCFQDPDIRGRSFYPEFRRAWSRVFDRAVMAENDYFDLESPGCYIVHVDSAGMCLDFHIDQLKIYEWYEKELARGKKLVFSGKRLKRNRHTGQLMYKEVPCGHEPDAPEPALEGKHMRNVMCCALPCTEARLQIVYGNKFVEKRFNPLRMNSVDIFLIGTDYVPAFLGNALEAALYLFLMDYCIIKTNFEKVRDEDLKGLLHVMRPSPMLRIKGLI